MLVGFGFLGRWEGYAILGWLGAGLLTLTRLGERTVVRIGCGFRRLSEHDRRAVDPVWTQVLARCGVSPPQVDLYVQHGAAINAYAVGSRSVALTSRVITDYRAGRIDVALLAGVMAHELGHYATRGARFMPLTLWYVAPWRLFYRGVLRLCFRVAPAQPLAPLAVVALASFVMAIVQGAQAGAWNSVFALCGLVVFGTVTPMVDSAASRASERAADRYAAAAGYGAELARALAALEPARVRRPRTLLDRVLDRHPATSHRIGELPVPVPHRDTTWFAA